MTDERNAQITTTAVFNRLVEGERIQTPLRDEDVKTVVDTTMKVLKAQMLVVERLNKLGLLK
jgi:hypothetical protein